MARIPHVLGLVLAVALLAVPSAAARPGAGDHQLFTTHFEVHYYTDVDPTTGAPKTDYSTETQAGDIAAYAEQAYALFSSWGYTPPLDDGDGHIDIWLSDLSATNTRSGADWDNPGGPGPSSGWFEIATPTQLQIFATKDNMTLAQEEQHVVAANVFYMFEFAKWVPTTGSDEWLFYGPAEWAAEAATNFTPLSALGNPDIALSCHDNLAVHQMCDPDFYSDSGAARWAFFDLLASKYGNAFLNDVLTNGGAGQTGTTALANALAAKGTSLANVFDEYAADLMDGGIAAVANARPLANTTVATGTKSATLATANVPANHLSARYIAFQRGDGSGTNACFAATLAINVAIPSGTSSQPYFYWDGGGASPQALTISGNTASITVPWDTCNWGAARGWLSLPNASTTVDGAMFTVTSSVTVDTNTQLNASSAPPPATVWGTTVAVPTADVPPSIDVFGPELVRLDSTATTIRLIVDSTGPGTVDATLGSVALGARELRAGNNDLRFSVPKGVLTALRRSASAANLLTLTPMSPNGSAAGAPVTRQVVIAVAKAKAKAKAKTQVKKKK